MSSWLERAKAVLPEGGFGNFDASFMASRAKGSKIWDIDGNEYIDYLIGSGPMLVGHGHPEVLDAVQSHLDKGFTYFTSNPIAVELAEEICDAVPCAEQLRYVSTGGEADMYAMRLARAYTGRNKILKFEGGYHGMSDEGQMSLMPRMDQLVDFPTAIPDSAGILSAVKDNVLSAPYNDFEYVTMLFEQHADDIAGIIVEPLQRIIPPKEGFLKHLRDLCTKHGALLIFDEVVTGFRLSYGGAQEKYGVTPDLCTLGKTIGGGFPLAAIAGRRDVLSLFNKSTAGSKWLMQIGTLSGNPIASIAGLKTLEILKRKGQYDQLRSNGRIIQDAITESLNKHGIAHKICGDETLFDIAFTDKEINDYRDVLAADQQQLITFNDALREKGILKAINKFYVHLGLSDDDLQKTVDAIAYASSKLT
jgi:glutamate-1-semialdehyde 2,1-aminomutase